MRVGDTPSLGSMGSGNAAPGQAYTTNCKVAATEFKVSYHNPETILFAINSYYGNFNEIPDTTATQTESAREKQVLHMPQRREEAWA